MFTHLIESSSHGREFRRRGYFVLFTTTTYALLFVVAGVISIYAYDARLSDPNSEPELLGFVLPPPDPARVFADPVRGRRASVPAGTAEGPRSTRPVLFDQPNNPLNPPPEVSASGPQFPPAHPGTAIGPTVIEPSGSGSRGDGSISKGNGGRIIGALVDPPPPVPILSPAPKKIVTSPRILNSQAILLPKPPYPPIAKLMHVEGVVSVQVLIDESGKIVSAKAVSGNSALTHAAQQAALLARFSPTLIDGQPVKVSGVITYNFVLH